MPKRGHITSKLERDDWEAVRADVRRRYDAASALVQHADIGSEEYIVGMAALRAAKAELDEFERDQPPP